MLTAKQSTIIHDCLNAVVNGPFIPAWEFHTLFGLDIIEVKKILDKWPDVDLNNPKVKIAINNTFNNLLGYPIAQPEEWQNFISVSKDTIEETFLEWKRLAFT
jgi:hypothetical protein